MATFELLMEQNALWQAPTFLAHDMQASKYMNPAKSENMCIYVYKHVRAFFDDLF